MTTALESLKNKRNKVDELNQKIKTLKADLNKMQDEHESSEIINLKHSKSSVEVGQTRSKWRRWNSPPWQKLW